MSAVLLELRSAGLSVRGNVLLQPLDLAVHSGEILGVAGSNGAGKSSLLRLTCGEKAATTGEVLFEGQPLQQLAPAGRAARMAVLPQHTNLQFDFSVRQVIELGRAPHGGPGPGCDALVQRIIADCELEALSGRSYLSLSGGEKQRVQLARILAQLHSESADESLEGQLLLLDEPTAAMDIRHQQHCLSLLCNLQKRGCTVVIAMHDINLLGRCADRLLFLKNGALHALGATTALLNAQTLSAVFDYPLRLSAAQGGAPSFIYPVSHVAGE